ncbi:hypothetical protein IL306_001015 [Fusarium sp. DS 682]|nr:hypothetical protein IL306_001015 [Fusarium sp. DS 682]
MTENDVEMSTNQAVLNVQTSNGSLQLGLKLDDSIARLKEMIATREDGSTQSFELQVKAQSVIYHVKDMIRGHLGLRVRDQKLRVGYFELHNGRRLSFYTRIINPDDPLHVSLDVINTGPKLSELASRSYFQIFIRTLTG